MAADDKTPDNTREALLKAAKTCFASQGFEGTTIRELADAAGVNIALVTYHFGGKEGLYRACLEEFGKNKVREVKRLLKLPRSREELRVRLQMFMEHILGSYVDEPEVTRMIHRDCELHMALVGDLFRGTFLKIFETFGEFVKSAQKNGLVRGDLDANLAARQLFSVVINAIRSDSLSKEFYGYSLFDAKYRAKFVDNLLILALDGITAPSKR